MSTDIQSRIEMVDEEELVDLDGLSPESKDQFDVYIEDAKQKLETVEDTRKQVIIDLAEKISGLPGIEKTRVASFIAFGFRYHNVGIRKNYVYRVLKDKGYVDPAVSDKTRRTQRGMYRSGWNPQTKTFVNADNYDVNYVRGYGRAALENVVRGLHRKVKTLEEKKTGLSQEEDDGSASHLRVENETLKQENAGLKEAKCWSRANNCRLERRESWSTEATGGITTTSGRIKMTIDDFVDSLRNDPQSLIERFNSYSQRRGKYNGFFGQHHPPDRIEVIRKASTWQTQDGCRVGETQSRFARSE